MTAARPSRADYRHFVSVTTRWMDNDVYGHVNNVTYYSYFDTAANQFLIAVGGLDIHRDPVIGLVVESACQYHAPIEFPQRLSVGLRVDRLGQRAVTYGLAIFVDDDAASTSAPAVAHGHFVHVFVDRATRRPVAIPEPLRAALRLALLGVAAGGWVALTVLAVTVRAFGGMLGLLAGAARRPTVRTASADVAEVFTDGRDGFADLAKRAVARRR